MKSNKKLKRILESDKPWYIKGGDSYLRKPILYDFLIGVAIVLINYLIVEFIGHCFIYEEDSIADILNELISSTLASGGFILAALAILASIKQGVFQEEEKPENERKRYFFNGSGFKRIINIYSFSCLVFLFLFTLFTILRSVLSNLSLTWTFSIFSIGVVVLLLTLLRCTILLWILIKN